MGSWARAPDWYSDTVSTKFRESLTFGPTTWSVRQSDSSIRVRSSRLPSAVTVPGGWGIPIVTAKGHRAGASLDGSTLVLAQRRRVDQFAVVRNGKARILTLNGDFAVDALSNDGATLYLTETVDSKHGDSVIRSADVATGFLRSEAVLNVDVDASGKVSAEATGSKMRGKPVDRVVGSDGWTYTLYANPSHAFVHALDTKSGGRSICFDLPSSWNKHSSSMKLSSGGSDVSVTTGTTTLGQLTGTTPGATLRVTVS